MSFRLRFSCWAPSEENPQGEFAAYAANANLAEDERLNDVRTNRGNGNVPPRAFQPNSSG